MVLDQFLNLRRGDQNGSGPRNFPSFTEFEERTKFIIHLIYEVILKLGNKRVVDVGAERFQLDALQRGRCQCLLFPCHGFRGVCQCFKPISESWNLREGRLLFQGQESRWSAGSVGLDYTIDDGSWSWKSLCCNEIQVIEVLRWVCELPKTSVAASL